MRQALMMLLIVKTGFAVLLGRLTRGPKKPSWNFMTEFFVAVLRLALGKTKTWGIPWLRGFQSTLSQTPKMANEVSLESTTVGGVPCEVTVPVKSPDATTTLLAFHGGGYVFGSAKELRELTMRTALACNARVVSVDYRLGPEHPFPAAQDDCLRVTNALIAEGQDPKNLILMGDSAGGGLCLATLIALRDAGQEMPAGTLLISPWVDPAANDGSMVTNELYDIFDRDFLRMCFDAFMGGQDGSDPRVQCIDADLTGLPPLFVIAGEAELFIDQITEFNKRAEAASVDVTLKVYPDMTHDFPLMATFMEPGRVAIEDMAKFVAEHTQ